MGKKENKILNTRKQNLNYKSQKLSSETLFENNSFSENIKIKFSFQFSVSCFLFKKHKTTETTSSQIFFLFSKHAFLLTVFRVHSQTGPLNFPSPFLGFLCNQIEGKPFSKCFVSLLKDWMKIIFFLKKSKMETLFYFFLKY